MPKALVIFDVDRTLMRSMAVDSKCYVSAFCDHLGIDGISTVWETSNGRTSCLTASTMWFN